MGYRGLPPKGRAKHRECEPGMVLHLAVVNWQGWVLLGGGFLPGCSGSVVWEATIRFVFAFRGHDQ